MTIELQYNLCSVTLVFIDKNDEKIRLTLTPYDKQSHLCCIISLPREIERHLSKEMSIECSIECKHLYQLVLPSLQVSCVGHEAVADGDSFATSLHHFLFSLTTIVVVIDKYSDSFIFCLLLEPVFLLYRPSEPGITRECARQAILVSQFLSIVTSKTS